ncbi:uncharacterized protein K489DRAFT_409696 [Dissoconium aciculare CBS 342.82]|uniref:Uncharacterized protein n=1 Tax=Dissoconium aciculare CBS 342.82 TaxID=1314786 RepID=A0A6J3M7P1_9PEZI|nr:uncharacterized protein K489DRAFT_409696 [Dissoconium aciculare CBS 342.82]KAF1823913.1 hypothetical protein K489DRAFT_409696 [Dissoconium aciculare CBS 342.82]
MKRKKLRECLEAGTTIRRTTKAANSLVPPKDRLTVEEKTIYEGKLDLLTRWNVLMLHSVANYEDLLWHAWGDRVDVDSDDWQWGRQKVLGYNRLFKSRTLAAVKDFVAKQLEDDTSLRGMEADTYATHIGEQFSSCD